MPIRTWCPALAGRHEVRLKADTTYSVLESQRPANAAGDVCAEDRIVRPDVVAMAECRVERAAAAGIHRPGLRVIAAARNRLQPCKVHSLGVETQEHVDAAARERHQDM